MSRSTTGDSSPSAYCNWCLLGVVDEESCKKQSRVGWNARTHSAIGG
jgi:hypothetical protein